MSNENKKTTPTDTVNIIKTDGVIEQNDLSQIQEIRQKYSDIIIALGQLSINKRVIEDNIKDLVVQYDDITKQYQNNRSILESQIADIDKQCEEYQSSYNDTITKDEQISQNLQDKYGSIEIVNFETGEYKRISSTNDDANTNNEK